MALQTHFINKLINSIQAWANTAIPTEPAALRTYADCGVTLLSSVKTQHDLITANHATRISHLTDANTTQLHDLNTVLLQTHDAYTMLQAEHNALDELRSEQRATIKALSGRAPGDGGERPVPISDPATFNGTKEDLDAFLDCLENKLRGDAAQFTSEIHQISYVVSRLTGDAFEQIQGTYTSYTTVAQLTNALKAAFGDPDPKGTAQRLLTALRQRNQDFSRYLADFIRLSNRLNMTEETKRWTLRAGLSPGLKEEIQYKDQPTTLPAYIDLRKRSDIKMKGYQAEAGHHRSRTPQAPPQPPAPPPTPQIRPASTTTGGVIPMDLSAGRRQVPQQERDARMREGRCFYCGGIGHLSSTRPAKRRPSGYPGSRPTTRISGLEIVPDLIDLASPPPIPTRRKTPSP